MRLHLQIVPLSEQGPVRRDQIGFNKSRTAVLAAERRKTTACSSQRAHRAYRKSVYTPTLESGEAHSPKIDQTDAVPHKNSTDISERAIATSLFGAMTVDAAPREITLSFVLA